MNKELKTPEWIDSLIDNLAPLDVAEEIRGDLYEFFLKDIKVHGEKSARRKYVANGLGFLAKRFFWRKPETMGSRWIMPRSYLKMATRSLTSHKGAAIINMAGLVIGIACAIVILAVIRFELSFDSFHSNSDRIYRMVRVSGDDMSEFRTGVSYPVPDAIKKEIPSLDKVTSMEYMGGVNIDVLDKSGASVQKFREENGGVLLEQGFFDMFDFRGTDFKWLAGNPASALKEPFTVVLTKTMALKYFGNDNPIGRTLRFQKKYDCKVTGVVEDFPPNTDFPFTILVSYESIRVLEGEEGMSNWFSVADSHNSYVLLSPYATKRDVETQIEKVHGAHTPKELHEMRHYLLQELNEVHYDARFRTFSGRTISKETLLGLGIIAAFLLITASINYINLSTAQSALRAREIGVRKVMGSDSKNLVFQLMTETFLLVLFAGVLALLLSEILIINFQSLLNLRLADYNFTDPFVQLSWVGIIVLLTLLSGFYPALVVSRFSPIAAIQNKFATRSFGGMKLRKVLVVAQFTITQMLVVGTFIVVGQMRFFQNQDMGFNREAIITAKISDLDEGKRQTLENQLRLQSFVSDVSFSFTSPSGVRRNRSYLDIGPLEAESMEDYSVFEFAAIDPNFLGLYEIPLLAGRNLTKQDTTGNILLNITLAKNLGFVDPEEAIGKELKIGGGEKVTVVGVVADYYSNSLKEGVDNIVMLIKEENYSTLNVKLAAGDQGASLMDAVKGVERIWNATYPEFIFSYQFLDENIAAFYAQEERYAKLFQIFSFIFLVIGCLGLYGLITFVVNRKGKEVAIRKVLGATIGNVLVMFSSEYVRLILLSFLLAVPVTYYVVNEWLSNFANHIQLQWWYFVAPGLTVLAIALFVVLTKSFGTANANPVDKLKYE